MRDERPREERGHEYQALRRRSGRPEAEVVSRKERVAIVRVVAEGPLLVRGPVRLLDEQGGEVPVRRRVNAICRCGRSASQPFCDGTHKVVPFSPRTVQVDIPEGSDESLPSPG
jgi:CDGSH-type Zn-finger protein